jgi:DNA adenine methylase
MVGSGALFFWIAPANCILSDINPELINFYRVLKNSSKTLVPALLRLRASKRLYYQLRTSKPSDPVRRAVRFAYLNRLCWNGLYRVNRLGQFNVPMGDRFPIQLWRRADLEQAAQALRRSKLLEGDFIETLKLTQQGDFVFLDPPYPRGSTDARDTAEPLGFSRYSSTNFSVLDHERLGQAMRDLTSKGVMVLLLLADDPRITCYYPPNLQRQTIFSKALISCRGDLRRRVRELILCNYRL